MLTIYIDGWCGICKASSRFIKRWDTRNKIEVADIRLDAPPNIDIERAKREMASVDERGNVYYGFASLYEIVKRIPYFWIVIPLFWLLKITSIGNFLYRELAIRRRIIPLHCSEKECNH